MMMIMMIMMIIISVVTDITDTSSGVVGRGLTCSSDSRSLNGVNGGAGNQFRSMTTVH